MSKGIREAPGKALIGDLAAESGDRTEGAFGALYFTTPCRAASILPHMPIASYKTLFMACVIMHKWLASNGKVSSAFFPMGSNADSYYKI